MLFSIGINSYSQTPDGETPAVEDVCDGLEGASYGLCNAYCEVMDCDNPETKASAKACEKVLANFEKKTGSAMPPCEVVEFCGDGFLDPGETCDDSGESATCNADCSAAVCGDGQTNTTSGETCDDGNTDPDDGSDASCRIELTILCLGGSPDGVRDDGEECDDGNNINYDICTNACTLPTCGDGIISHGEQDVINGETQDPFIFFHEDQESCEDGNTDPNDGCSPTCRIEYCGDGVKQDDEESDWDIPEGGSWISAALLEETTAEQKAIYEAADLHQGQRLTSSVINIDHVDCDPNVCDSIDTGDKSSVLARVPGGGYYANTTRRMCKKVQLFNHGRRG